MIEEIPQFTFQDDSNDRNAYDSDEPTYANETQILILNQNILNRERQALNLSINNSGNTSSCYVIAHQLKKSDSEGPYDMQESEMDLETKAAIVIQRFFRHYCRPRDKFRSQHHRLDWKENYKKLNVSTEQDDYEDLHYIRFWDQSTGPSSSVSLNTNSNSVTDSKGSDQCDLEFDNAASSSVDEPSQHTDLDIIHHADEYSNEHVYDSIPYDMASPTPPGSPMKDEVVRIALRNHHIDCPMARCRKYSDDVNQYSSNSSDVKVLRRNDNQANSHSVFIYEEDLSNKLETNLYVVRTTTNKQPVIMAVNKSCPTHKLIHHTSLLTSSSSNSNNSSNNSCNNQRLSPAVHQCQLIPEFKLIRNRMDHHLHRGSVPQEIKVAQLQKATYAKRMYRVGLNLFNKSPPVGIQYLISNQYIKPHPSYISKFLLTRNGVSRNAVGEYLGLLNDSLAQQVTKFLLRRINMKNKEVDEALRSFIYYVHLPGESQKISYLMEEFKEAYVLQNPTKTQFRLTDTVMVLAYAIIMLQTDAHSASVRKVDKMTMEQFVNNLRGVDDNFDIDRNLLESIYSRVTSKEMKTMPDHSDQVRRLNDVICGPNKLPDLVNRIRRFMCYCRLTEIADCTKKTKLDAHQREVFLFNDLLLITKSQNKSRKEDNLYLCKYSLPLVDIQVKQFRTTNLLFGIQIFKRKTNESIIKLNARCEEDQKRFLFDLADCIYESLEMQKVSSTDIYNFDVPLPNPSPKTSPQLLASKKENVIHTKVISNFTPNPPRRQESLSKNGPPDVLKPMYQARSRTRTDVSPIVNNYGYSGNVL